MFDSYSSSSSSSSSSSKSSANNKINITNAGVHDASEMYGDMLAEVKSNIVGSSLVKIYDMEVGLFQLQESITTTHMSFGKQVLEFFYGFRLNNKILSGSFEVVLPESEDREYLTFQEQVKKLTIESLVEQVGQVISNNLIEETEVAYFNLRLDDVNETY